MVVRCTYTAQVGVIPLTGTGTGTGTKVLSLVPRRRLDTRHYLALSFFFFFLLLFLWMGTQNGHNMPFLKSASLKKSFTESQSHLQSSYDSGEFDLGGFSFINPYMAGGMRRTGKKILKIARKSIFE